MEEQPYSNREIKEFFGEIKISISSLKNDLLTFRTESKDENREIILQTRKTNGRVGKLENWKYAFIGGWIVITVILLPIIVTFLRAYLINGA